MTNDKKTRVFGIIPARLGSTRFPRKPLAQILGMPMIEHVWRRTSLCGELESVLIATCDHELQREAEDFGAQVIMTSPAHARATERVAEAAQKLELADDDVVVMIQGDEPLITPEMISAAVQPMLTQPALGCVNLIARITTRKEFLDPNTIKVVKCREKEALYFSRAPIPHMGPKEVPKLQAYKQVCVIPFRVSFLRRFAKLPPTPLELVESIDMLRALEHGIRIHLVETSVKTHAVDVPEDLEIVEKLMAADKLFARYDRNALRSGAAL